IKRGTSSRDKLDRPFRRQPQSLHSIRGESADEFSALLPQIWGTKIGLSAGLVLKLRFGVALLSTLSIASGVVCAQDYDATQRRMLNGHVMIAPGTPPPGRAMVVLFNSINMEITSTTTSNSGTFSFSNVPAGEYRIVIRLAGYQETTVDVMVPRGSSIVTIPMIIIKPLARSDIGSAPETVDASLFRMKDSVRKDYVKAQEALEKGNPEQAQERLVRVTQAEEGFAPAFHFLGVSQVMLGRFIEAEASFRRALELNEKSADSHFGLGRALNLQNRPAEALAPIARGLEILPESALGMFEQSRALFLLKDYAKAESTARLSLDLPSSPPAEVRLILANCYLNLRRYPDAATQLELYIAQQPKSPSAPKAREVLNRLREAGIQPRPAGSGGH
ncbi:MAG: tetratricopeptide repeat protein, partial [Acidobacteria bacterium]|nr:tetratricopeptide repeat protein [Acidobacteriota bacterium]